MGLRRVIIGGAGSAAAVGIGSAALLLAESYLARRRRLVPSDSAPSVSGAFGKGPRLRLVIFGDSMAAGLGVDRTDATVGGLLAETLADTGRRVLLDSVAVAGSRAVDLEAQIARAVVRGVPDVAVVLTGAEDASRFTPVSEFAAELTVALRRLRTAGAEVVVGTCPDLAAAPNFPKPFRDVIGWSGRRVAAASERATRAAGGIAVDLAARTGARFRAEPALYCPDGYHPSAAGYRLWAGELFPPVYEASRRTLMQP